MAKDKDTVDLTDPAPDLEVGAWVTWSSNGKAKTGEVIAFVEGDQDVEDVIKTLPKHTYSSSSKPKGDRPERSYLVLVDRGDEDPVLYWPIASTLKKTKKPAPSEAVEVEEEEKPAKAKKEDHQVPDADKAKAKTDASKLLDKVMDLKEMTDTENWQRVHRHVKNRMQKCAEEILEAEKSREVVQLQMEVKALRNLIEAVKDPVEEYARFCASTPLFAAKTRASWSEQMGQVVITKVE